MSENTDGGTGACADSRCRKQGRAGHRADNQACACADGTAAQRPLFQPIQIRAAPQQSQADDRDGNPLKHSAFSFAKTPDALTRRFFASINGELAGASQLLKGGTRGNFRSLTQ